MCEADRGELVLLASLAEIYLPRYVAPQYEVITVEF